MERITKDLVETHTLGPATREWLVSARQVPALKLAQTKHAGFSKARSGYQFVRHAPAFSQILACTGGAGRVLINGRWQRCPAGYAYLTAPHALCAYEVPAGGRWNICWVILDDTGNQPVLATGDGPRLIQADTLGLQRTIEGLCHEAGGENEPAALELWATLMHRQVQRILQPGDADPRLRRLWQSVRQDLGGTWNLARMARCAGLSPESLRRFCQQESGRPPLAQLTHLRMLFAADLLTCTAEKISSIAARAGYEDAFAFSSAFKREMGVPPSLYRSRSESHR